MMDRLDEQRQRQVAIGILVLAVVLLLAATVLPVWVANASRQAEIDDASERLQRYQLIAARDSDLLPQYESMLRRQRASGKHLRSETVALAGAELQRRVTSISSENGARVMSTQILPTSSEEGFLRAISISQSSAAIQRLGRFFRCARFSRQIHRSLAICNSTPFNFCTPLSRFHRLPLSG